MISLSPSIYGKDVCDRILCPMKDNLSESLALITHKGALVAGFLEFFICRITKRKLPAVVCAQAFNFLAIQPVTSPSLLSKIIPKKPLIINMLFRNIDV